jgi:hypothetical protein
MILFFLAIGLSALAAGWVVLPLVFRRWSLLQDEIPVGVQERDSRRRVALAALRDVEYDHAAGKLDDVDYREMRGRLETEALQAIATDDPAPAESDPAVRISTLAPPHSCGFANPAGSRFCSGCGQRLG